MIMTTQENPIAPMIEIRGAPQKRPHSIRHSKAPMLITFLVLLFFYTPLVIVAISSFNTSRFAGNWEGFTLKWYVELFQNEKIWSALETSLLVAVLASIISTVLGLMTALALYKTRNKFVGIYHALVYTPLVVPDILMGISLLLFFLLISNLTQFLFNFGIELGLTTIVIAHVTFCVSYVVMVILGRLKDFDQSLLDAAYDLGASKWYTFVHVTLPVIMPGIIAGALFAFTLSIDDFVITFFVKGPGDTTLPVLIQSAMKRSRVISPAMLCALSVIFLIITFITVFIVRKITTERKHKK